MLGVLIIKALLQDLFRNQGGFDMIGSGRDKIESQEDLKKAATVATQLSLDGLVIVGGDDSNTNAAVLAEYFASTGKLAVTCSLTRQADMPNLKQFYILKL